MPDASVVRSDLSFSWPDDTPVFQGLSFAVGGGRTGLVAPNGAGKSTLLRLIAGELRPSAGAVSVTGVLGHLPQSLPLTGGQTVGDVLGVAPVLAAITAIESGDAREAHFTTVGTDWDVEERTRAQLDRLGLDVALDVGPPTAGPWQPSARSRSAPSAARSWRSGGRSGRGSRPGSAPIGGPGTRPAPSPTPACRGSSPAG